jgi:hypothetical protein
MISASLLLLPLLAQAQSPTFSRDIAPLLTKHCISCHRADHIAPMSLTSYREVRPWARAIQASVQTRKMPPWHADPAQHPFRNNTSLKPEEIQTFVSWARNGAPQGDAIPPLSAPQTEATWQLPTPDSIFAIPEFSIPTSLQQETHSVTLETNWAKDVWVQSIEILPGNRRSVHHVTAWLEQSDNLPASGPCEPIRQSFLASFVPGQPPSQWPSGAARRLPAHARIRLEIHYAPSTGREEKDQTRIGFRLSGQAPSQEVRVMELRNTNFEIPAGAAAHALSACYTTTEEMSLISYLPQMRYRGTTIRLSATPPLQAPIALLNVPRFSYEWQTQYQNQQPVRIPAGSRLTLSAIYDNSANNPSNPDPTKSITQGEELLSIAIEFLAPRR